MSMNPTVQTPKFDTNAEGATAFIDKAPSALFNIASSFVYKNGGYFHQRDRLESLEKAITRNVKAGDKEFVLALAWFLGKVQGLRLSPTVMLSNLVFTNTLDLKKQVDRRHAEFLVSEIFTRPDFIANSLAYYKIATGASSIGSVNSDFKNILKNKFTTYKPITLKKRKMKSREITLADLIKVLRPRPSSDEMSQLYKAIIENDKLASLTVEVDDDGKVVKADSGVAVLSNDSVSQDDKIDYLVKNINKLPINELIRNMSVFPTTSYNKLMSRLDRAFSDISAMRFINPFDLVLSPPRFYTGMGGNKVLRSYLDELLERVVINNINFNVKNPVILVDVSGSMSFDIGHTRAINKAVKYMSFIIPILLKSDANIRYYEFNTRLHKMTHIIRDAVGNGSITTGPNKTASHLLRYYGGAITGGTSLRDAVVRTIREVPNCDGLFIFTDEVSWADQRNVREFNNLIPKRLNKRTFVFNVDPDDKTMFSAGDNVVRVGGLSGNSLFLLNAMLDFDSFKNNVVKLYNSTKESYAK